MDNNEKILELITEMNLDKKEEFKSVRTEMQEEFKSARTDMQEEFTVVYSTMQEEFKNARTDMQEEFTVVYSTMQEEFSNVYSVIRDVRTELKSDIKKIEMTLKNETNKNISMLIEGQQNLNAKIDKVLKFESEKELLTIRIEILENELIRLKARFDDIA